MKYPEMPPQGEYWDQSEVWPAPRLRRLQWRRLRRVVRWAFDSLPFYRTRWEAAGFHPDRLTHWTDLRRIPILTKADVLGAMRNQQRWDVGLESPEQGAPAVLCMSSGTLGTCFLFLPQRWRRIRGASTLRAYCWAGLRPGMTVMTAAPAWHGASIQESYVAERVGARVVYPWGTFLPKYAGSFVDTLLATRPDFLFVFLPILYAMLAECRQRGLSPQDAFRSVKTVLAVGAPMTPRSQAALEQELGVDLMEGAGVSETLTAMECRFRRGHHVLVDTGLVEIVDPKTLEPLPPGQRGTLVTTSLIPHGSLYIRYNTEDVAEILPGECPCGRTWPRLEIYDRWANAFTVRGARRVPYDVRECLDDIPGLLGVPFAVLRTPGDMPGLRVAVQRPATQAAAAELETALRERVQQRLGAPVEVVWAETLPVAWKGLVVIEEADWRRWQSQTPG